MYAFPSSLLTTESNGKEQGCIDFIDLFGHIGLKQRKFYLNFQLNA